MADGMPGVRFTGFRVEYSGASDRDSSGWKCECADVLDCCGWTA